MQTVLTGNFVDYINRFQLFNKEQYLLIAVSGGLDSAVLCELCHLAGYRFAMAHCNFQLRGGESERDKEFVRRLAKKYDVAFFSHDFDTASYAESNKLSIQEAARELRYQWLFDLIGKNADSPNLLVTAHHADDNIETLLMNFFKGTGIGGLKGILPKKGNLVRPLLFARKETLQAFANERGLEWVEDTSNLSDKYSRNYFRLHIIPLVSRIYPAAIDNVAGNLERFREIELLYDQAISVHRKKILDKRRTEWHIPVLKLKKSMPLKTIVYEIINDFGFTSPQVDEVIKLLDSDTGKYVSSSTHRVIRHRAWLIIAPLASSEAGTILIEEGMNKVSAPGFSLNFSSRDPKDVDLGTPNETALLDSDLLQFPFILRKSRKGDYFYPLGMRKKKKLNRFFIDNKFSITQKENTWVLEMDKKVVWVIGQRIDDRFKVTDKTRKVIKIEMSSVEDKQS